MEYGISKLDIPVMGGPNVAINGDLVIDGIREAKKWI